MKADVPRESADTPHPPPGHQLLPERAHAPVERLPRADHPEGIRALQAVLHGADAPLVAQREGPGLAPGLTPHEALRSAERALADAEARLAAIAEERTTLDREAVTWQQIADRYRALIPFYRSRVLSSSPQPEAPANRREKLRAPSVERFGKIVMPIADALIASRLTPIPIDEIYRQLPQEIRQELQQGSDTYSPQHRIRRMFRRNKKYVVDATGVTFSASAAEPKTYVPDGGMIEMILRRPDGGIAAFQIAAGGKTAYFNPVTVRAALRTGKKLVMNPNGNRESLLKLAGNRFYSDADGIENDDFKKLPEKPEEGETTSTA
jgi:hypothetical protein